MNRPSPNQPSQPYPSDQPDQPGWSESGHSAAMGDVTRPVQLPELDPAVLALFDDPPGSSDQPGPHPGAADGDPGGGSGRHGPRSARSRRHRRPRPLRRVLVALVVMVLATSLSTYAWAEVKLQRKVDLDRFGHRPPPGEGTNYLIVGSDSRAGLSASERSKLRTGVAGGRRADSMILLHTGAHGTTMVSLPRDSWVTIPAFTRPSTGKRMGPVKNKLNAAFAWGGPELLSRTVEHNTGVRLDHYAEIGFAGFVDIVNSVGGVRMCLDKDIRDESSGADLREGCQTLDGTQALAFVRQRHQEAEGDLGRTRNQQKFLSALADRVATPGTMLNPAKLYPALRAGLDTLVVDEKMALRDLNSMFRALQGVQSGGGKQINVPVSGGMMTSKGSAVRWDEARARKLFAELKRDRPVTAAPAR